MEKLKSEIILGDEKIKLALEKLKLSKTEDKQLYDFLIRAFEDLEKNAFCGIQIPKKLIPKEYHQRYGNLDNYSDVTVLSIILEWMKHKDYENKFKY